MFTKRLSNYVNPGHSIEVIYTTEVIYSSDQDCDSWDEKTHQERTETESRSSSERQIIFTLL